MGTPLYNTDIIPLTSRPTLTVMDDGDYFTILDTSTGKISKILKTNLVLPASQVSYDNATSGLTATQVQAALDELVVNLGSSDSAISALVGRLDILEADESTEGSVAYDIKQSSDALKGVGYTDGTLKTHEDRLDTLEGADTVVGSVAKTVKDTAENATFTPTGSIEATDLKGAIAEVSGDVESHLTDGNNPHAVTKAQVGLGNVDNTSDVAKPVSAAQQAALDLKVSKSDVVTGFVGGAGKVAGAEDAKALDIRLAKLEGKVNGFAGIRDATRAGSISNIMSIGDSFFVNKATASSASASGVAVASYDEATFYRKHPSIHAGSIVFVYSGTDWLLPEISESDPVILSEYGIAITGTPAVGSTVTIMVTAMQVEMQHISRDKDIPMDASLVHTTGFMPKNIIWSQGICPPQALVAAPTGMPAGTYHLNLKSYSMIYYLNVALADKNVQFTTTVDIPAGGQLVISDVRSTTSVSALTLTSYSSPESTAVLESGIACTEGTDGTDLGLANTVANSAVLNSTDRTMYGSSRFGGSPMMQWLNSSAKKGLWWSPSSPFDRKPSWVDTVDGFMYGMQKDFLDVLKPAKKTVNLNWFDGGGTETLELTFWLPSAVEVYMSSSPEEGQAYDYFKDFSDLAVPGTGADSNRIKTNTSGTAIYWWLRTPYSSYSNIARVVSPDGSSHNINAYNSNGVVPACIIA
jgi:hypothetical protein